VLSLGLSFDVILSFVFGALDCCLWLCLCPCLGSWGVLGSSFLPEASRTLLAYSLIFLCLVLSCHCYYRCHCRCRRQCQCSVAIVVVIVVVVVIAVAIVIVFVFAVVIVMIMVIVIAIVVSCLVFGLCFFVFFLSCLVLSCLCLVIVYKAYLLRTTFCNITTNVGRREACPTRTSS
jgi:hypothetical protein